MRLRGQAGWLFISLLFDNNLLTHRIGLGSWVVLSRVELLESGDPNILVLWRHQQLQLNSGEKLIHPEWMSPQNEVVFMRSLNIIFFFWKPTILNNSSTGLPSYFIDDPFNYIHRLLERE